jgi:hypothetical protein
MVAMNRCRVAWTGFTGAPGVSTFYFGSTTIDMTALKAFFTAVANKVPTAVQFAIPQIGDQVNDTNGQIVGAWSGTGGGTVLGTGGVGAYAGSAGICIDWLTSSVIDGRRRQGRTYLVPGASTIYQSDGTIAEAHRTDCVNAGAAMIAAYAGEFKVFSRPYPGQDAVVGPPPKPAKPPRVGAAVQVIAARVPDIAAVMRSRRQ